MVSFFISSNKLILRFWQTDLHYTDPLSRQITDPSLLTVLRRICQSLSVFIRSARQLENRVTIHLFFYRQDGSDSSEYVTADIHCSIGVNIGSNQVRLENGSD